MNSGEPYSPTSRGPFFHAYQYIFLLPSASVAVVQCNPLASMRIDQCPFCLRNQFSTSSSAVASVALLKSNLVPSGMVMLVTGLPVAFSACAIILLMLGLRL